MSEDKRFTTWGDRIKRDGNLLNIEFNTKTDAKLCCKLLNQMDKDSQEYVDKLNEIYKWHKEHYGKSILAERLEFKSDCEKENERLKKENEELKNAIISKIMYEEDLESFAIINGIIEHDWGKKE